MSTNELFWFLLIFLIFNTGLLVWILSAVVRAPLQHESLEPVIREEFRIGRKEANQIGKTQEDRLEYRLDKLRQMVESGLDRLQESNEKKLEQMRETVDEKLQGTLEKRLGESFKQVSERLEQVHKGLGEMQQLATGVGDLKKVLTNVKTRGTWGEVQLGALLEQILTSHQYESNVKPNPTSNAIVEFAIRLPGPDNMPHSVVWLPIDAKFPLESYHQLLDSAESGDAETVKCASSALAKSVELAATEIRDKYLSPPHTTDFGILFLPTEGLYAEVVRDANLLDRLQQKYRVVVAGPTTLAAMLNSLQMGFRTLAIEERSSEVWKILSAVKVEFGKFGDILDRVKKQLDTASRSIDQTGTRSRAIEKQLRSVEELPSEEESIALLGLRMGNLTRESEEGTESGT